MVDNKNITCRQSDQSGIAVAEVSKGGISFTHPHALRDLPSTERAFREKSCHSTVLCWELPARTQIELK